LVKGRKRHILVDTLGLLLKVMVTEANAAERDGAAWLLLAIMGVFGRL
jgi:putative transposase